MIRPINPDAAFLTALREKFAKQVREFASERAKAGLLLPDEAENCLDKAILDTILESTNKPVTRYLDGDGDDGGK